MLLIKIYLLVSLVPAVLAVLRVKDNKLIDQRGGHVVFHGLNVVEKNPPYIDINFNETDMKLFKSWGMNGLRLGVMWPGVQPNQGEFNQTYLQQMKDLVNLAGQYNIHTLVEFHQDLFSRKFCADGVPLWAIPNSISKSFPWPLAKKAPFDPTTGLPKPQTCQKYSWGIYYFTKAVNQAFNSLWTNKHGLLDKFVAYWKKVASTFKNNTNVIAYQLINEPWPGNIYRNPLVMVPHLSEIFHLQQAYDRLAIQIKAVDSQQNICFQPVTWLNGINAGFSHPPGGKKYSNNSILCYHFYKPPSLHDKAFMKARMRDIKKLGIAGLLSQFYVEGKQGQQNSEMMDLCQQHSQSWFGWYYNPPKPGQQQSVFTKNGYLQPNQVVVSVITRTYAQRIAGDIILQHFDTKTKAYSLKYTNCQTCGETKIYFSKEHQYKNGLFINCYPSTKVTCEVEEDIYVIVKAVEKQKFDILVTITESL